MFDSLLDESRFVKKKAAEAEAKGRVEGEIEALRQVMMEIGRRAFRRLLN